MSNESATIERSEVEVVIPDDIRSVVETMNASEEWQEINRVERALAELPQVECPLRHVFTPGLYAREITMPTGALITSRIHKFEHPFVISKGVVSVWSKESGWQTMAAPFLGITTPAKRRVLYIHEETVWTTFHVTSLTDPDKIVDAVTFDHMQLGHMSDLPAGVICGIEANAKPARELP